MPNRCEKSPTVLTDLCVRTSFQRHTKMATISFRANTVRPFVDRILDGTAFETGTFFSFFQRWQDPVHSWKEGSDEVMAVEKFISFLSKSLIKSLRTLMFKTTMPNRWEKCPTVLTDLLVRTSFQRDSSWEPIENRVSPRSALLKAAHLEALLYLDT